MSQKDMYNNEILEEILRERSSFFINKNKNVNFWIINNPYFINNKDIKICLENKKYFVDQKEKNFSCLLSTDLNFIQWIKLRLGFFETLSQPNKKEQNVSASNGIFGNLEKFETSNKKYFVL
jgi:hypothetical protein